MSPYHISWRERPRPCIRFFVETSVLPPAFWLLPCQIVYKLAARLSNGLCWMVVPKETFQGSSGDEHSPSQAALRQLLKSNEPVDGSYADAQHPSCFPFAQSDCSHLCFGE